MRIRKAFEEDIEEISQIKNGKISNISKNKLIYFYHLLKNNSVFVIEDKSVIGYIIYETDSKTQINLEEFDILDKYKTKQTFDQIFQHQKPITHYVNIKNKSMIQYLKENNFQENGVYAYVQLDVERKDILSKIAKLIFLKFGFLFLKSFQYRFAESSDLDSLVKIRKQTPEFKDEIINIKQYYKEKIESRSVFLFMNKNKELLGYVLFNYYDDGFCNIIDLIILPGFRGRNYAMFMMGAFLSDIYKNKTLKVLTGMVLESNERMLKVIKNKFGAKIEEKYILMEKQFVTNTIN